MSTITDFLKEIGLLVIVRKDEVTLQIGGKATKKPVLPKVQPPTDDSAVTGDEDEES
jgi:hypothetical protein